MPIRHEMSTVEPGPNLLSIDVLLRAGKVMGTDTTLEVTVLSEKTVLYKLKNPRFRDMVCTCPIDKPELAQADFEKELDTRETFLNAPP